MGESDGEGRPSLRFRELDDKPDRLAPTRICRPLVQTRRKRHDIVVKLSRNPALGVEALRKGVHEALDESFTLEIAGKGKHANITLEPEE